MSAPEMSPLAMAAKRVVENQWQNGPAYDLASQAAKALESAQLLQSPETAAEHERTKELLREAEAGCAVADDLTAEWKRRAEAAQKRVAELEAAPLPAWVRDLGDELPDFLSDLVSAAICYYDEDTPDDVVLSLVERAFAKGRDRARARLADVPAYDDCPGCGLVEYGVHDDACKVAPATAEDAPAAPELTVFRASHDAIPMGLYTTAAEARKHCEAKVRQEEPAGSIEHMSWWADDVGDDAEYELHITPAGTGGLIRGTRYVVTPLAVASAYDEEADE